MKALVLAAGKSTRISGQIDNLPKPLIEIGGKTILEHSLAWLSKNGIKEVWINLHFRPEMVKAAIGDGASTGTTVSYSFENKILGTAGAVKNLEELWDDDFLVIYGDNIMGFNLQRMIEKHKSSDTSVTIAVYDWEKDTHSGIAGGRVVMDNEGRITGFFEVPDSVKVSRWVNAGAYVLSPKILNYIPEGEFSDFGRDIFPLLLSQNISIKGFPTSTDSDSSYCLAADTPEALAKAREILG